MRDPVAPIPSPHVANDRARAFWRAAARPPPPAPSVAAGPRSRAPASGYDPTRLLGEAQDVLGIDRRASVRTPGVVTGGSALTAAQHVPLHAYFGLQTSNGWALVRGLCMSPRGVLVHLFDPCSPDLDAEEIRIARSVFSRLAPILGVRATGRGGASPLAAVGGCVLAPRVVADLSRWANGRPTRRTCDRRRRMEATLVLATSPAGGEHAFLRIPGEIVPLNDPHPDVLGVALDPEALHRFDGAVARLPARRRPRA